MNIDYFLWGHLKDKACLSPMDNNNQIMLRIQRNIVEMPEDIVLKAPADLVTNGRMWINRNKGHFEQEKKKIY